jgi:hypothetical protein
VKLLFLLIRPANSTILPLTPHPPQVRAAVGVEATNRPPGLRRMRSRCQLMHLPRQRPRSLRRPHP